MAGISYKLTGSDSKLKDHVGHKVEVTGTVDKSSWSSGSGASTGSTSSTTPDTTGSTAGSTSGTTGSTSAGSTSGAASGAMGAQPSLKVQSVRMIAATCS
jgi:hypothetical protein